MNKKFVKTKNVKEFVEFMEELKSLPPNIPKIALVYGDYGLGKSKQLNGGLLKTIVCMFGQIKECLFVGYCTKYPRNLGKNHIGIHKKLLI